MLLSILICPNYKTIPNSTSTTYRTKIQINRMDGSTSSIEFTSTFLSDFMQAVRISTKSSKNLKFFKNVEIKKE